VDFAKQLKAGGFDLVSTGGTARDIQEGGLDVQQVSDLTGSPEILDGRVKTLHPKVHAGILARRDNESHMTQLSDDETGAIDIVVCNLYPFVETVSREGVTLDDALENIDIGGPTMIRAAAKNFQDVLVVVDPSDYEWIGERVADGSEITLDERKELARKAFQHVALYDTAISRYLSGEETQTSWDEFTLGFNRVEDLRYGENPHQQATLYSTALSTGGIVDAKRLHGLEMSFTNILDADAAWRVVSDFSENAVAVIKHTNPCGLAVHPDQAIAYQRAFEGDSVSAYGGIVGFNRTVTVATAEAMKGVLYDQIVAPGYEPDALKILKRRRKTRILEVTLAHGPTEGLDVRTVSGGVLVQTADTLVEDSNAWNIATERPPTADEFRDLAFAWRACKHIKSNTIVLAKDNTLVGMGAGQPNRVVSVHLSLRISGDKAKGSVMASDAFFPFGDSVEMAAEGGITAIVQPGGSIRDEESVEAANRLGIAMVLTGTRHFRH
jgi:phosphoribosylaminoimidazolecarboxamide formyltransferase/IMP cyclohydrolase